MIRPVVRKCHTIKLCNSLNSVSWLAQPVKRSASWMLW